MPFDVAFALDGAERLAFIVALGELDGGVFDFAGMRWQKEEA